MTIDLTPKTTVAKSKYLAAYVEPALKVRLQALADSHRLSESELIRRLLWASLLEAEEQCR